MRLLGAVEVHGAGQVIARWPSRAVAVLLARLALAPQRSHPREELVELLWPGVAPGVGRNRLRQALSALKSLLEAPGANRAPVLDAHRGFVRVVPGSLVCDAVDFEQHLRAGEVAAAASRYAGELMPGHYDDWVIEERRRLADLYEQSAPALAERSTPSDGAAAIATLPSLLPNYLTRTFGVEQAAARLRRLVLARRLVTLHGPGGSGKTRLAVEVARSLEGPQIEQALGGAESPFEHVVFVALLACKTQGQVLDAVAAALRAVGPRDPRARILTQLEGRRVLLVLDNAEQLDAQADAALAQLLSELPSTHTLITSRRLLGLDGEHSCELESLPLPRTGAAREETLANAAVALFVDRARAVQGPIEPMSPRWPRLPASCSCWAACRWPSNWRPRACARSTRPSCCSACAGVPARPCSTSWHGPAPGPRPIRAMPRCATCSTGAGSCCRRRRRRCCGRCRSSVRPCGLRCWRPSPR